MGASMQLGVAPAVDCGAGTIWLPTSPRARTAVTALTVAMVMNTMTTMVAVQRGRQVRIGCHQGRRSRRRGCQRRLSWTRS